MAVGVIPAGEPSPAEGQRGNPFPVDEPEIPDGNPFAGEDRAARGGSMDEDGTGMPDAEDPWPTPARQAHVNAFSAFGPPTQGMPLGWESG